MPAPVRTTNEQIFTAALDLVDAGGPQALTMHAVAARVGVRAPSLYKRIESRDHLLGRVAEDVTERLATVLESARSAVEDDPRSDLVAMAHAVRAYAHAHPNLFRLLFDRSPGSAGPSLQALRHSSAPVLAACARLAGEEHALEAARTVTAWMYGFLTMELAGAFQLGGDPEAAFEFGASTVAAAVDRREPAR